MLAGNNDDRLLTLNIHENCIPFYQIWQELVDPRTLDIYQYRVLTSLSALIELQSVIQKTLSGLFNSDANIDACREELLYLLNHDVVLNKYYRSLLNRLKATIGKKASTPADKNRLLQQIGYAIIKIEPNYLSYALTELKNSILSNQTKDIESIANLVASQAIFMGWSTRGLFDLLRYFRQDCSFDNQWNEFKRELLNSNLPEHCVLINIPFRNQSREGQQNTIDTLQRLGLTLKIYNDIVTEFSDIEDISRLIKAEKRYFCVHVNAKDIYAASHLAITEISEQLNFVSFYNLVDAWDLQSVVIVPINTQNKYHKSLTAKDLYSTHDYLDSSGRIFEYTRRIFSEHGNHTIREKLQGSFGYTNISRASLFQEEKYMNLWVALESLARTNMYSDIISNIKETVPAAISLRYIYRIVRNFVEDCKRCGISLDFSTYSVDTEQDTKQKMVKEMISVFKDDALFSELQNKCQVHACLKSRINDIRSLLTNVTFAKDKIENHHKHISWQIQRLYRIRNEIAHAALREQTSLIVYIEHLYHYLSGYISEIVTCLVGSKLSTIEEALCLIKDSYDVFISLANSSDTTLVENDLLQTGVINLISGGN